MKHIKNAACSLSYACSKDCPHKKPHYTWGMGCNKYRYCPVIEKSVKCVQSPSGVEVEMSWDNIKRAYIKFEIPQLICPYCSASNAEFFETCWKCGFPLNTPYKWVPYKDFRFNQEGNHA